jgi:mono/diheme cytochrome c family protein
MKTPRRVDPRWKSFLAVLAIPAALGWLAAGAGAQDPEGTARGKITYRVYCQNCHGESGKGDGKLAELIKIKVADLTAINQRNGGTFPTDRIYRIIDGREEVLAHGDREMPVWGQVFLDKTADEKETRQKIDHLVLFLQSIQQSGAAK